MQRGKVYLVGAGPGDPKLITVRGLEAIERADAIVYDRLANPRLLRHAKPGAELHFVGKLPDKHMMKQEDINKLLVELARQGKVVTRLKGGDPSVFGRVGEEAEELADADIPFEIVPGITSSIAVPVYAGIPVTHRDFTSSFAIVTGHEYPNKTYSGVHWDKLSTATGTLIFLMGVANIEAICSRLMEHGKPPETPAAVIRMGTWMEQQTLTGTVATIAEQVKLSGMQSPAIIIVGEVVKLREKLAWFEKRPLFGRRYLVTRAREQASELVRGIEELGGEAVEFPVIRCQPTSDPEQVERLDQTIRELGGFDWIVFTSVNGVDYFFRRLIETGADIRNLGAARLVAVGPKTQEALRLRGLTTVPLPSAYKQEGIADALEPLVEAGQRVLLPTGDLARDVLRKRLEAQGLSVTEVDAYETVQATEFGEETLEQLREGGIHVVTFTSSSTVMNLLHALKQLGEEQPIELLNRLELVCIGPVTAQTAEEAGLRISRVAPEATIASLLETLQQPAPLQE
ncbi:uroporphyrinogen-III C-methyltransferase [Paenibacillus koleovorans]|uniref:uroporphyrinogen-III C-methyltransferase n=1 Tax=Paenibacillus koleovorans TaxID=121608 RepID=UPI000FD7FCF9|nr:uroporphyrinogen-III C-methyltransferase [Paenibacillus koleovorans]